MYDGREPKFLRDVIIFVVVVVTIFLVIPRQLDAPTLDDHYTVVCRPDSSSMVTVVIDQMNPDTGVGSKTYTYSDFLSSEYGTIRWQIQLIGTFENVDGSWVCSNADCEVFIYNTLYNDKDVVVTFDGETATCTVTIAERFVVFPISEATYEMTLTCAPDGTLS